MQLVTRDSLPLGGFAGIREHRLVTDSRVFAGRKPEGALEGLGNFIYLADARYVPNGESGMHPHSEVDVISVVLEGRVAHEGSMEHGKNLEAGDVQVQRAGGEGFSHNEINPDNAENRMLQLWALPEVKGQRAGYKSYRPAEQGATRIYGGSKEQTETFDSQTLIDIVRLDSGSDMHFEDDVLCYVFAGQAVATDSNTSTQVMDGSLLRGRDITLTAVESVQMVVIRHPQSA